jgi:hypothetical protein
MTIGYYAIPAQVRPPVRKQVRTLPYPFCRACLRQAQLEPLAPIDEQASPSLKCRGCRARLRQWR